MTVLAFVVTDLKEKVLSLPEDEKRDIFNALRANLDEAPLLRILNERRRLFQSGEMSADSAEVVFDRLLARYS
ncbi:MAG: hypothetical protein ACI8UO_000737 [Verrucomicrobiales bacterium]